MAHLRVDLLGNPKITHGDRDVSFRTRKALALLIYLIVEGDTHSRAKLVTLFWPESDPDAGRATLRSTLRYLRKGVAHASDETQGELHLIVERDALSFNLASDYDLDLAMLDAATETTDVDRLSTIADRCRGEFLEGFSLPDAPAFDDWMSFQREKWHRRMTALFDRLSELQGEHGDYVQAIETATQWIEIDPYDERTYRRLMQLQFAAGSRAAALQTYERCRDMLHQEFDASPAPETEALAERIRQEGPSEQRPSRLAQTRRNFLLDELPFLGRAAEHATLVRSFYAARDGASQVDIIVGEAGIGKTRLAREFLAWARANGADVIHGRAFEAGGRLPYQPIVDALRPRIDRANSPDDLLSDVWLAEVSRLLPELRDRYPDLPPPSGNDATTQTRMFEAVSRLCMALAERRPLVIFIDDLHWADIASLDLLQYAVRRWHGAKASVLLLTALRAEELARAHLSSEVPLRDWLAGLERDVPLTRIELDLLSAEDVQDIVAYLLGATNDERRMTNDEMSSRATHSLVVRPSSLVAFSEWLHAETQGHPFFVTETFRALLEDGVLSVRKDDAGCQTVVIAKWAPPDDFLAPRVREVVRSRLSKLSADAFNLLAAGAVLGHDFTADALWQVADVAPTAGLQALDELLAGRLLVETDETESTGAPSYSFTHDRIRDVTYTEAGDARRHLFHNRAVAYLEARSAAPAQLAHHAQAAGLSEATFRYNLEAGDEAMALYAVRDAIEYYDTARRALGEHPGRSDQIPVARQRHLYARLGRAYELVDEWERARAIYREMRAAAQDADVPEMEVAALNHLADLALREHLDVETADTLASQAQRIAEQCDDRVGLARAELCMAQARLYKFEREEAIAHGERALELARDAEDEARIADSLNVLSYAKYGALPLSHLQDAEAHAQEAAERYTRLGNRPMVIDSRIIVAAVNIHAGRPHEAVTIAREAHDMAVEIDNAWGKVNTAFNLAQALFECGQWGEAWSVIDRAVTTAEKHTLPVMLVVVLGTRGTFYNAFLAHERARADHERAYALCKQFPNPHVSNIAALDLCADCVVTGDWAGAYRYAQDALPTKASLTMYYAFRYWRLVEALLHEGDVDRARDVVVDFGERIGDHPRCVIPYRRSLALLADHEGHLDRATAHIEAAGDAAAEIGLPGERWHLYAELGELYVDAGDAARAQTVRAKADEIVQQLAGTLPEELGTHFLAAARQCIFPNK